MGERPAVLIVEDDLSLREALCDTLKMAGYGTLAAGNGKEALEILAKEEAGMVVADVQMSPMDGHTLLHRIKVGHAEIPVVMMTAYGTIQKAVDAMRNGAADYLVKPFEASVLVEMVSRLLPDDSDDGELIAADSRTQEIAALAVKVAASEATVMITGPSGSGKEVFARHIHRNSNRNQGPFIAINCAAIPENMLEAMLFGYEKGAFTGAHESRPGKFEQAQKGTLLLDEVTEMPLELQSKLLRVLQEREVERLGARKPVALDVRVLATSNRNVAEEVMSGSFREDLFYRLNVFPLYLPPLVERPGDILPLARRLITRHASSNVCLAAEAEQRLLGHSWPGNIRELDNVVQRALILQIGDEIQSRDLYFEHLGVESMTHDAAELSAQPTSNTLLGTDLRRRESELILETLRAVNGNRKLVAERLGISPRTLRYKLARLREAGVVLPG